MPQSFPHDEMSVAADLFCYIRHFFQDLRDTIGFTPQKSNIDTQNGVFFSKGNGTLETWRHFGAIHVTLKMLVVSFILIFTRILGEDEPILTHVFSNGLKPPTWLVGRYTNPTSKDGKPPTSKDD